MNKILILFTSLILLGCNQKQNHISIKLHTEKGNGVFMPGSVIIWPNNDSIDYTGIPKILKEYVVRTKSFPKKEQYYWEQYRNGQINKEIFFKIIKNYQIDTTKLTNKNIDNKVSLLIGTNSENKRVIIIDSNNDEDFNGEQILEYEYPIDVELQQKIILPSIETTLELFVNGEVVTETFKIQPSPYKGSLGMNMNSPNEIENKYFLFVSFPEYKKGELNLNSIKYDVNLSNAFISPTYDKHNASIFINQISKKNPSELNGDIPYRIGEIFNSNGKDYQIENISIWGDSLTFKYIGNNNNPTGIVEGMYLPKFNAKTLDNSIFTLDNYTGQYILFDFWGTWCKPCIKVIPELKELNNKFKDRNFSMVSVAYDSDVKKVNDFIVKEDMNWKHLFVNQNQQNENSLVAKLKISSFPSTILIDPNGKIIARNKDFEELTKILAEKTNAE